MSEFLNKASGKGTKMIDRFWRQFRCGFRCRKFSTLFNIAKRRITSTCLLTLMCTINNYSTWLSALRLVCF